MHILFSAVFMILIGSCHQNTSESKPVTTSSDQTACKTIEDRVHGYLGWHLVYYLNLKKDEWTAGNKKPIIPFRKLQTQGGIGNGERIPFVTYYAPSVPKGSGFLSTVVPSFIIQLDNRAVSRLIPEKVRNELQSRNISYESVPTFVTISILPKEQKHDPAIRTNPVSLFPHNWVHNEIADDTNRSINVASGLYDSHGVNIDSDDIKTNGPIGLDKLTTYGAYIHPSGNGSSGFSSRQALFQLDPQKDVSDFWSLSVDVDNNSPHKNSAILMYHVIFTGEKRAELRNSELFELINTSIDERSKALDNWYDDLKAKNIPFETQTFPRNFPANFTAKDIIDNFDKLEDVYGADLGRISAKLRELFCAKK